MADCGPSVVGVQQSAMCTGVLAAAAGPGSVLGVAVDTDGKEGPAVGTPVAIWPAVVVGNGAASSSQAPSNIVASTAIVISNRRDDMDISYRM